MSPPDNPYPPPAPAQIRLQILSAIALSLDTPPDDPQGSFAHIAGRYQVSFETVQRLAWEPERTLLCGACVGAAGRECRICNRRGWLDWPQAAA